MRERVASTVPFRSVPFRSVPFRRQKLFYPPSYVRSRFTTLRFTTLFSSSSSRVVFELVQSRHYTARRDRGVVDRSTDRSCRSEADWRWVSPRRIAGFTKTTRRRRTNRRRATGIRSETRFVSRVHFHFPFPPAGARSIRSLCRSSTPPRRRVNGDDGLFSIDDAGREEGEKTDATRRDPPRSGVGFACERRMDLADGTDRRMRIYTSFET